jgi:hypothetical protein
MALSGKPSGGLGLRGEVNIKIERPAVYCPSCRTRCSSAPGKMRKRLERYAVRVREKLWQGDTRDTTYALADFAETGEIARQAL